VGKLHVDELFEKIANELLTKVRLELVQVVVTFNQLFVIVKQRLSHVELYLVVQDLGQTLASS